MSLVATTLLKINYAILFAMISMIIRSDGCTILILHRCCCHEKDDHEVAWRKSSSSFLMVLSSHSSRRRLWWYYISQRIVFVCHLSQIILQDLGVHFVLWWIVQVLDDFVLHFQVCSKFVVLQNLLNFLLSFAFLNEL